MNTETHNQPPSSESNEVKTDGLNKQPLNLKLRTYLNNVWHFLVKVIGPTLTVLALVLAIIQLYQANKAERENKSALGRWHPDDLPKSTIELASQIDRAGVRFLNLLKSRKPIINTTAKELPIFMWISDDKRAIFSLHNYGQSPREHSFITSDPRFIQRLKEIAEEAFVNSQEYRPDKSEHDVNRN